jgi:DNA transformation protein and related proteins
MQGVLYFVRQDSMKSVGGKRPRTASLSVSDGFRIFVVGQLEELGDVTARSMFGGVGLYRGDLFFGIIARDVLYLKADDETRRQFEAIGARPFKPYAHRSGTMNYYSVPVSILESPADLTVWARKAVAAAARTASTTTKRRDRD